LKAILPTGKLRPDLLKSVIQKAPIFDPRLILGPGIGLDCGIVDIGSRYLIMKTDPITFATEEIGWYAVQITANDIATTGAKPVWMMVTALFPEGKTTDDLVLKITDQLFAAAADMQISLANAHTEITVGLDRPILICSMIGEVSKEKLITPAGARPGDDLLLTKGIPIEGTALLAKEFPDRLKTVLTDSELLQAQAYTHNPGIGVSKDAAIAVASGRVTGMHDPTEGGLAAALWEFSEACGSRLEIDTDLIPISSLSKKICESFQLNPLNTIASGSLLLSVHGQDSENVIRALTEAGIPCARIGSILLAQETAVWVRNEKRLLQWPEQDDITKFYSA